MIMKLIFMGTPDFAVPCLESLIAAGHEVCAVFTQPDKPKGRSQTLTPPPVKVYADKANIPVYQPASLKGGAADRLIASFNADAAVVVAYGKIIPASTLKLTRLGFVNVHASLLPKYRGAAPIQWAIVDGDEQTGVTTMLIDEGLDTGDMLETAVTPIDPDEHCEALHDRLSALGAELILTTLSGLDAGTLTPVKQNDAEATYAKIISKEMAHIDWSCSARQIHNLVRGFDPWPVAYSALNGRRLKVYDTAVCSGCGEPGTVIDNDGRLVVACGDGSIELLSVQLEGSRRMSAADMLRGNHIDIGYKF